ncbi:CPBP family intramembrane metalloprotease [Arthrobacter crusticola]|uniref:CPBP family intramembrane metalloprotease n=1 Tax=Arthrobacter crusticola TaxID=2547960 RepID=A0A4R5TZJ0_9MICC|nr:type II CAAX endopeptidase family protein [Arthrobacter crusticola]TDK26704.1 CPBP family intramembrane metalloprotease [Arthrobacter crusticola]
MDRIAEGPSAAAASNREAEPPAGPAGAPAGEAFPFHRLTRSWAGHRWWKPLLTGLLGTIFYLVFMLIVLVIGGIRGGLDPALGTSYLERLEAFDLSDPLVFGFAMVSLILLIPALALAALITGPRPIGLLSSVHGRIRWGWLGRCLAAAAVIYSLSIALSFLLEPLFPGYVPSTLDLAGPRVGILIAMTLLLVPFQATAEEYVFRGYLMQAVGSWLRHPAFAILLPVPLFVLGHGYDLLGQLDVALFAVFAGWITWRTGGLEAAIAAHVVNNSTIFLLGAVGLVDVNAKEGSAIGLGISVLTTAAFAVIVLRMFDRSGSLRRDRIVVPAPVPAIQPYAQYPYGQYPFAPSAGQYTQGQAPAGQYPPYPQGQAPAGQYPPYAGQYPPPYAAPNPHGQAPAGQYPPPYPPAPDASGFTPPAPYPSDQHQEPYLRPAPAEQRAPENSSTEPQSAGGPSGATPSGPDTRPRDQARRDR